MTESIVLCDEDGCLLTKGHKGVHEKYPASAWSFMEDKDRNKLTKAGFATPRGGNKGAYQNHVLRNNRVIIPYEKLSRINLSDFKDGYVVRLFPDQYFERKNVSFPKFTNGSSNIVIGQNAFILYRTHESYEKYPPLKTWDLCSLEKDGLPVKERGKNIADVGHYVLRIPSLGLKKHNYDGPPQGLFAPEYADERTNFLCKCVLAWLIIHAKGSPYTTSQASHLELILRENGLMNYTNFENRGILRHDLCCCPLCTRIISYVEFHEMMDYEETESLENAASQVEGATRSTIVNLFHLEPLTYDSIKHIPANVAWGHAVCNSRLGQRACLSLFELRAIDLKVGIIKHDGIETFGWISTNKKFIRGPNGSVWIQISEEMTPEENDAENEEQR